MFDSTWLVIKEAQTAIRQGEFVQACRAARDPRLRRHRRAGKLVGRASRGLERRWVDMAGRGFAEAVLAEMRHAADVVAGDAVLDRIHEGLRMWVRARRLAQAGQVAEARVGLARAAALMPELAPLPDLGADIPWESDMAQPDDGPTFSSERRLAPETPSAGDRMLLWVDGVGAYLVCLGDVVRIGQATDESPAEVPVLADLSRVHATIRREEGEYTLTAHRPTLRNGRPVDRTALTAGDRIRVGSVEMAFEQPNPGSASALLCMTTSHRLPWAVDGVILWADMLILGPEADAHVRCAEAGERVMLFRQSDGLWCRGGGELEIGGRPAGEPARLTAPEQVRASGISFALEPLA
jgi:FHA domain-containing protein